jgi:hypothetical protein
MAMSLDLIRTQPYTDWSPEVSPETRDAAP